MKRVIRPAEEEIGNVVPGILFSIFWYCSIGGIKLMLVIFLIARPAGLPTSSAGFSTGNSAPRRLPSEMPRTVRSPG